MNLIYKYELDKADFSQRIYVPKHSKVLCVQMQKGNACMWVQFPEEFKDDLVALNVTTVETGQPFDDSSLRYIGTYQTRGGDGIRHVYVDVSPLEQLFMVVG